MVSIKQKFTYQENGEIDLESWFERVENIYHLNNIDLIKKTALLAQESARGLTTFYGQASLEHGLEIAEIVLTLRLDQEAVATGILIGIIRNTKLTPEPISEKISPNVAKLLLSVLQMDTIHNIQKSAGKARDQTQIDRFRKLILAMASDIRVVLIKLAERTSIMRGIKNINPVERKHIAEETMDVYAPLANRLGIGQLKWELEDVSFHYIDPLTYKTIAKFLAERRADRENHIHNIINKLKEKLIEANIYADISGRAKHIYSIYLKAQRKKTNYQGIYDYSAIRILVPTLEECYTTLSIVHSLWEHIPQEFDDYITSPKPNGYRSIHTAVIGPDNKNFEIQIRTHAMHEEAERGVAAHWVYKEGKTSKSNYEAKIVFLRQLLDWHRDVANQEETINPSFDEIITDRIYIFTPAGDILDLPAGATPLDCAYQIHSEVGNKCRGAKINGHIVPLTYTLRTGDQIEILTNPKGTPSRDWLNSDFGYLTTARAKAKVSHWFRQQDLNQHIESGRRTLEREFSRLQPNIQKLANHFHFKDEDSFLAAMGRGNIRPTQVLHFLETHHDTNKQLPHIPLTKKQESTSAGMNIAGISDLMTRIARCCKPIPGDPIIGFITQGRGVTIHKKTCSNMRHINSADNNRLIDISWDAEHKGSYYVDLQIKAHVRENLLKEITTVLGNAKLNLVNFSSNTNRNNLQIMTLTIQIHALDQLNELLNQMTHLRGVIEVKRMTY